MSFFSVYSSLVTANKDKIIVNFVEEGIWSARSARLVQAEWAAVLGGATCIAEVATLVAAGIVA